MIVHREQTTRTSRFETVSLRPSRSFAPNSPNGPNPTVTTPVDPNIATQLEIATQLDQALFELHLI